MVKKIFLKKIIIAMLVAVSFTGTASLKKSSSAKAMNFNNNGSNNMKNLNKKNSNKADIIEITYKKMHEKGLIKAGNFKETANQNRATCIVRLKNPSKDIMKVSDIFDGFKNTTFKISGLKNLVLKHIRIEDKEITGNDYVLRIDPNSETEVQLYFEYEKGKEHSDFKENDSEKKHSDFKENDSDKEEEEEEEDSYEGNEEHFYKEFLKKNKDEDFSREVKLKKPNLATDSNEDELYRGKDAFNNEDSDDDLGRIKTPKRRISYEQLDGKKHIKFSEIIKEDSSQSMIYVTFKNEDKCPILITDIVKGLKNASFEGELVFDFISLGKGKEIRDNNFTLEIDRARADKTIVVYLKPKKLDFKREQLNTQPYAKFREIGVGGDGGIEEDLKKIYMEVDFNFMISHDGIEFPKPLVIEGGKAIGRVIFKNPCGNPISVKDVVKEFRGNAFWEKFDFDYIAEGKKEVRDGDYRINLEGRQQRELTVFLKSKNPVENWWLIFGEKHGEKLNMPSKFNEIYIPEGYEDLEKGRDIEDLKLNQLSSNKKNSNLENGDFENSEEENINLHKKSKKIGGEGFNKICGVPVHYQDLKNEGGVTIPKSIDLKKATTDGVAVDFLNCTNYDISVTDIVDGLKNEDFGGEFVFDYIAIGKEKIRNNGDYVLNLGIQEMEEIKVVLKPKDSNLQNGSNGNLLKKPVFMEGNQDENIEDNQDEKKSIKSMDSMLGKKGEHLGSKRENEGNISDLLFGLITYEDLKNQGGVKVSQLIQSDPNKREVVLKNKNSYPVCVSNIFNGLKKENFGEDYVFDDAFESGNNVHTNNNFEEWVLPGKDIRLTAHVKPKDSNLQNYENSFLNLNGGEKDPSKDKGFMLGRKREEPKSEKNGKGNSRGEKLNIIPAYVPETYEGLRKYGGVKVSQLIQSDPNKREVVLKNKNSYPVFVSDIFNGLKRENFGKDYVFGGAFKFGNKVFNNNNFDKWLPAGGEIRLTVHVKPKDSNLKNYENRFILNGVEKDPSKDKDSMLGRKREEPKSEKKGKGNIRGEKLNMPSKSNEKEIRLKYEDLKEQGGVEFPKFIPPNSNTINIILKNKNDCIMYVSNIFNSLKKEDFGEDYVFGDSFDVGSDTGYNNNKWGRWVSPRGNVILTVHLKPKDSNSKKENIGRDKKLNMPSKSNEKDIQLKYGDLRKEGCVEVSRLIQPFSNKREVILKNKSDHVVCVNDIFNGLKKENFDEGYVFDDTFEFGGHSYTSNDWEIYIPAQKNAILTAYVKREDSNSKKENSGVDSKYGYEYKEICFDDMVNEGFIKGSEYYYIGTQGEIEGVASVILKNGYKKPIKVKGIFDGLQQYFSGYGFVLIYIRGDDAKEVKDNKYTLNLEKDENRLLMVGLLKSGKDRKDISKIETSEKNLKGDKGLNIKLGENVPYGQLKNAVDSKVFEFKQPISNKGINLKNNDTDAFKIKEKSDGMQESIEIDGGNPTKESFERINLEVPCKQLCGDNGVVASDYIELEDGTAKATVTLNNIYNDHILVTDVVGGLQDFKFKDGFVFDSIMANEVEFRGNNCNIPLRKNEKKSFTVRLKRKEPNLQIEISASKENLDGDKGLNNKSDKNIPYGQLKKAGDGKMFEFNKAMSDKTKKSANFENNSKNAFNSKEKSDGVHKKSSKIGGSTSIDAGLKEKATEVSFEELYRKRHVAFSQPIETKEGTAKIEVSFENNRKRPILVKNIVYGLKKGKFWNYDFAFDYVETENGEVIEDASTISLQKGQQERLIVHLKRKEVKEVTYKDLKNAGGVSLPKKITIEKNSITGTVKFTNSNDDYPISVTNIVEGLKNENFGEEFVFDCIITPGENVRDNNHKINLKENKTKDIKIGLKRKKVTYEELKNAGGVILPKFIPSNAASISAKVVFENYNEYPISVTNIVDGLKNEYFGGEFVFDYIRTGSGNVSENTYKIELGEKEERSIRIGLKRRDSNSQKEIGVSKENLDDGEDLNNESIKKEVTYEELRKGGCVTILESKSHAHYHKMNILLQNNNNEPIYVTNIFEGLKKDYFVNRTITWHYHEFSGMFEFNGTAYTESDCKKNDFKIPIPAGKDVILTVYSNNAASKSKKENRDKDKDKNPKIASRWDYDWNYKNIEDVTYEDLKEKRGVDDSAPIQSNSDELTKQVVLKNKTQGPIYVTNIYHDLKKEDFDGKYVFDYVLKLNDKVYKCNFDDVLLNAGDEIPLTVYVRRKKLERLDSKEKKGEDSELSADDENSKDELDSNYTPVDFERMLKNNLARFSGSRKESGKNGLAKCSVKLENHYDKDIVIDNIYNSIKDVISEMGYDLDHILFFDGSKEVLRGEFRVYLKQGQTQNLEVFFKSAEKNKDEKNKDEKDKDEKDKDEKDKDEKKSNMDIDSGKEYEEVPFVYMCNDKNVKMPDSSSSGNGEIISFTNNYKIPIKVTGIYAGLKNWYFGDKVKLDYMEDAVFDGKKIEDNNFNLYLQPGESKDLVAWFTSKSPQSRVIRELDFNEMEARRLVDYGAMFKDEKGRLCCCVSLETRFSGASRYATNIRIKDIFVYLKGKLFGKNFNKDVVVKSIFYKGQEVEDNNFVLQMPSQYATEDLLLILEPVEKNKTVKNEDVSGGKLNNEGDLKIKYEQITFEDFCRRYEVSCPKNCEPHGDNFKYVISLENTSSGKPGDKPVEVTDILEGLRNRYFCEGYVLDHVEEGSFGGESITNNNFTIRLMPGEKKWLTLVFSKAIIFEPEEG